MTKIGKYFRNIKKIDYKYEQRMAKKLSGKTVKKYGRKLQKDEKNMQRIVGNTFLKMARNR